MVSEITYDREKPFAADTGRLFQWANAIHVRTKESVIASELFFREGDCFDQRLVDASAQGLRSLPYITDATIASDTLADGARRVRVRTIDAWALSASLAINVEMGFHITGVSLNYKNVLGTGTQVAAFRNVYRERRRVGLLGRQPNLFGTRIDATLHGGETSPGWYVAESLFRPYPGEVGANAFRQSAAFRDDYFLYSVDPSAGFTQAYLRFEAEAYEATYQHRFGDQQGARFVMGLGLSRESFRVPFGDEGFQIVRDDDFDAPTQAPTEVITAIRPQATSHSTNRVSLTFGVRALSLLNVIGFDALRSSQDVIDGVDMTLTVAPGIALQGDDVSDVLVRLQGTLGLERRSLYVNIVGDGQARHVGSRRHAGGTRWRDILYELQVNGYWDQTEAGQLFGRVQLAAGRSLDRPFQLTLGGREAVRGYNEDAFPGARRLLGTVEQRFGLGALSTSFADLGVAFFADAGRGWAGEVPFGEDSGWKASVGAGLRVALPAGAQNVLRVDFGLPLTRERKEKGITFRVYSELFGLLDRRAWPTQVQRSRWYGIDPDMATRPYNPLARN